MHSIELFSGAGGLALGLEASGFEHVALVERNKDVCATLRLNRPKWNLIESDVRKVNFAEYGKHEAARECCPSSFSAGCRIIHL